MPVQSSLCTLQLALSALVGIQGFSFKRTMIMAFSKVVLSKEAGFPLRVFCLELRIRLIFIIEPLSVFF